VETIFNEAPQGAIQANSQGNKTHNKPKKKNKTDYMAYMEKAPITPFICKNHEAVHLRIRERSFFYCSNLFCNSCGFKFEGKSGYISCPKQSNCFNLCSVCKVCPKNHMFRNCASLMQFEEGNSMYAENKFKCMGCNTDQKVEDKGVMHCPTCQLSICMGCIEKLNETWELLSEQGPVPPCSLPSPA
jgi:hypothetical protein